MRWNGDDQLENFIFGKLGSSPSRVCPATTVKQRFERIFIGNITPFWSRLSDCEMGPVPGVPAGVLSKLRLESLFDKLVHLGRRDLTRNMRDTIG